MINIKLIKENEDAMQEILEENMETFEKFVVLGANNAPNSVKAFLCFAMSRHFALRVDK